MDSDRVIRHYYGDALGEMKNEENFKSTFSYAEDKINIEKSIRRYGGFFVGRYETTYDNLDNNGIPQGIGVKPNKFVLKTGDILKLNKANGSREKYNYRWFGLYKAQKDIYKENSNVGSLMITSKQWDEIMEFTKYNNITRAANTYTNKPDLSGAAYNTDSTKNDKEKNIYDLAGNLKEWTLKKSSNHYRVIRGGDYNNINSAGYNTEDLSVSSDFNKSPYEAASYTGSRTALYIK